MKRRKESLNTNFVAATLALAGLLFSLIVSPKTRVQANALPNSTESVSKNSDELKKTDYGKMPVLFEQNKGQTDKRVKFVSRGAGYTLYLTQTEAVFSLKIANSESQDPNLLESPKSKNRRPKTESEVLKMRFAGANKNPVLEGAHESVTKTNYYPGRKRFENLSNYKKANYKNIYDGIDAVFYGNANNRLEYDFTIAPQADAGQIGLSFDGAENLLLDSDGNLIIKTARAELVQQ